MGGGPPATGADLGRWLLDAGRRLGAAGIEDPRREAARLWGLVAGIPPETVLAGAAPAPQPAEQARLAALVERRLRGEPLAYLAGTAGFYGLEIAVEPSVLIPRPDSETLVDLALGIVPPESAARIVDVGTGSGCLLLSVLSERPAARGVGVDLSSAALRVAARNAVSLGLQQRSWFVASRWLSAVADRCADVVLANPPYVVPGEDLGPGVAEFEPSAALFTPPGEPLFAYRAILRDARRVLKPGGSLLFEVGAGRMDEVEAAGRTASFRSVARATDLGGIERALHLRPAAPE